jgi:hypothetical protein
MIPAVYDCFLKRIFQILCLFFKLSYLFYKRTVLPQSFALLCYTLVLPPPQRGGVLNPRHE